MDTLTKPDIVKHHMSEHYSTKMTITIFLVFGMAFFAFCFIGSLVSSDLPAEKAMNSSIFLLSFLLFLAVLFLLLNNSVSISQDGVCTTNWFRKRKVLWNDIESIEIFGKSEIVLKISGGKKISIEFSLLSDSNALIEHLRARMPVVNIKVLPDSWIRFSIQYPQHISIYSMLLMLTLLFLPSRSIILAGFLYGVFMGVCFFYCIRWVLSHWESFPREPLPVNKRIKLFLLSNLVPSVLLIGGIIIMLLFRENISPVLGILKFFSGMYCTCFGILYLARKQLRELWSAVGDTGLKD